MNWLGSNFNNSGSGLAGSTVSGNFQVSGNLGVTGNLDVSGTTTLHDAVVVSASLTVSGSVSVTGSVSILGTILVGSGGTPPSSAIVQVGGTALLSSSSQSGFFCNTVFSSAAVDVLHGFYSAHRHTTAAATISCALVDSFFGENHADGDNYNISRKVHFRCEPFTTGTAGNAILADNILFYGDYGLNIISTASNYLAGPLQVVSASILSGGLTVSGSIGQTVTNNSSTAIGSNLINKNNTTAANGLMVRVQFADTASNIIDAGYYGFAKEGTTGWTSVAGTQDSCFRVYTGANGVAGGTISFQVNSAHDVSAPAGYVCAFRGVVSKHATASAGISSASLVTAFDVPATVGRGFIGSYGDITTASKTIYIVQSDGVQWSWFGPLT